MAALRLLVGSYTATGGGNATGISFVDGGVAATVAVLDDPSFLAVSGDRVYAVSETAEGSVSAFRRSGTALEHLWTATAGGNAPCHVQVDPSGALVVTNYVSGTVTAVSLAAAESFAASVAASDGVVGARGSAGAVVVPASAIATVALPGRGAGAGAGSAAVGPVADRQDGPHAHQSVSTPEGTLLVADLGGDMLHEFQVETSGPAGAVVGSAGAGAGDGALSLVPVRVHDVAPGAGPRHMTWFDGDLIVAGELDGRVHRLRRDDDGVLRTVASADTFNGPVGESLLSHIEADETGRVTVAVRGRDVIVVLDASDGGLTVVGSAPCGGAWPRHFALVPGFVLVANERSDAIAVLPVGDDGVPGAAVAQIAVGTPTCVVPV
ncbi:beta-propeller fold lactonase family protein [Curtobacterium sp. VKM Ac-2865]|uniref:lactonase family protein n=1 Tax=Curtobacterium sp. VKM Ac-2865 TaxID=2783817 RepID=UPI00188A2D7A|nr:beta-propeller fold lactonase family protein [Curtobacterium sp. VKM Ac-2865]MBF4582913.1 beta-propeller fold lactonase family protein [Curtobacterium sp. VKM Ac-2865]